MFVREHQKLIQSKQEQTLMLQGKGGDQKETERGKGEMGGRTGKGNGKGGGQQGEKGGGQKGGKVKGER